MSKLNKLDISATLLNRLPTSICNMCTLSQLILDGENYIFPPKGNGYRLYLILCAYSHANKYTPNLQTFVFKVGMKLECTYVKVSIS